MWKHDIPLSPSAAEVLDEGEGLGDPGHDGAEEPVVVGADIGHRLRITFILRFAALRGSVLTIFSWILMLGLVASSRILVLGLVASSQILEILGFLCTPLYRCTKLDRTVVRNCTVPLIIDLVALITDLGCVDH